MNRVCGGPRRSISFLSSNPSGENRYIGRVEGDQIGAISGCELAERLPKTQEGRGMRRRKSQRVRQSNSEQANAILYRRRHVENRAGQRSIFCDAAAVACSDVLSVEGEMGMTAADGRHGIAHEHGV